MPSNFKKLVRDRMAKTGESYQTAARHVRSAGEGPPVGRFEALVLLFIRLAKARREEYEADPRYRTRSSTGEALDHAIEDLESPPPCDKAFNEAIFAIPQEDVWKLAAVMYAGRDNTDLLTTYRGKVGNKRVVMSIVEKSPLDEYLEAGLAKAKMDGFDLENGFQGTSK
ncbi:hypothetical protein [Polyangium sp. 15x6]|uniref:hypothetical protein n=1 Tax=Polyangium sp. 15x6 TaxID=3042687 RepID=UPI00249BCBE3|nr:hypothetical protein [Polyangium sp. 15x6]MDI3288055.1 hypothetical protein [Polyangium sp. 15x6]